MEIGDIPYRIKIRYGGLFMKKSYKIVLQTASIIAVLALAGSQAMAQSAAAGVGSKTNAPTGTGASTGGSGTEDTTETTGITSNSVEGGANKPGVTGSLGAGTPEVIENPHLIPESHNGPSVANDKPGTTGSMTAEKTHGLQTPPGGPYVATTGRSSGTIQGPIDKYYPTPNTEPPNKVITEYMRRHD